MNKYFHCGGEFEAQKLFKYNNFSTIINDGSHYLSGRYALEALFNNNPLIKNRRIYLPIYNCPSIASVVKKFFKHIIFYDIDKSFKPILKNIKKGSIVLVVDYFGKKNGFNVNFKDIILINDITHSIYDFNKLDQNNFFFASLRKHGIFNFGGWTNIKNDKNSRNKNIKYLENYRYKKFVYLKNQTKNTSIEKKLLKELKVEQTKVTNSKVKIDINSLKLCINKPIDQLKYLRKRNYLYLQKNIKKNIFKINYKKNETPMFLFVKFNSKTERDNFRKKLIERRIFCPIFWNIKSNILKKYKNSQFFSENLLPIPIDHRIGLNKLKYISSNVNCL